MSDELVTALRKVESAAALVGEPTTNWHRNPDGPEAADRIEALEALLRRVFAAADCHEAQIPADLWADIDAVLTR